MSNKSILDNAVSDTDLAAIKQEANLILKEVFPDGVRCWPEDLRECLLLLEERYKWCVAKSISPDNVLWSVWVGRLMQHVLKTFPGKPGLRYFNSLQRLLRMLLGYKVSVLPYRTKIRKIKKEYIILRKSFIREL